MKSKFDLKKGDLIKFENEYFGGNTYAVVLALYKIYDNIMTINDAIIAIDTWNKRVEKSISCYSPLRPKVEHFYI